MKIKSLAAGVALAVGASSLSFNVLAADTIKVGVLHSLSGTMAISETTLKDTVLMMIEEQNKKGGLLGKQLEPVVVDPASNWPLFAEKTRELLTQEDVDVICAAMREYYDIAVVTNDIYTQEDAKFLAEHEALGADRILGVETGGCPHAAIREDASMNLAAIDQLVARHDELDVVFGRIGSEARAGLFSRLTGGAIALTGVAMVAA